MLRAFLQTMSVGFRRLRRLATGRFARNVALITSGAFLAQLLALLSAPILTRLFDPEAFGLLGLFSAAVGLLSSSANLRYELPIVIARSQPQATALLYLCLLTAIAYSAGATVIVLMWGRQMAELFDAPQLATYMPWLPICILATGVFLPFSQWACRQKEFSLLARNPITRTGVTLAVQLSAGTMALGSGGLIVGFVAGQIAAAIGIVWRILRRYRDELRPRRGQGRRIMSAARRFRSFPQFSAPQEAINSASQQMPNFILAAFFGPVTVGVYWLNVRILQMPAQLVGQAVRQVFYQRISEILNHGEPVLAPLAKATAGLLALGAPAFLPIILFGPALFSLVFGEPWREAGEMARWVAWWSWLVFANVPAFCGLQAMGAQRALLIYEMLLFAGRNGALLFFSYVSGPLQAVAAYALAGMAFNVALISYGIWRAMKYKNNSLYKTR